MSRIYSSCWSWRGRGLTVIKNRMLIHPVGICHWCVFMAAVPCVLMRSLHDREENKKLRFVMSLRVRSCQRGGGSRCWVPIVRWSRSHFCHRYVWIAANYLQLLLTPACIQWLFNTDRTVSAAGREQEWPRLHSCKHVSGVKLSIKSWGNRNGGTSSKVSFMVCAGTMSDSPRDQWKESVPWNWIKQLSNNQQFLSGQGESPVPCRGSSRTSTSGVLC